jgi:DNA-directed RNA polymerase specialized sigma24 family protein
MFADEHLREWPALRERCLQGDEAAWSQFDRWVRPGLGATLRRALGRRVDTEELVQGVLIRLWANHLRRFRRLDPDRSPIRFLVTMGVRLFLNGWRSKQQRLKPARRRVRRMVVMHAAARIDRVVDQRLIPRVVQAAIDEFIKTLTAKGREVFLRVVLNVTAEEPAGGAREEEDTPPDESAGQAANQPARPSQAEERMVERIAVRFRESEAGV